jgi:hypothetical protein
MCCALLGMGAVRAFCMHEPIASARCGYLACWMSCEPKVGWDGAGLWGPLSIAMMYVVRA